ncbi:MAG: type II toxin-antitoxin system Phd/YefM family antitoxin [Leptospirales bacterium]
MITEISAVDFPQHLEEILSQVQNRHDSVVIKKDGEPVAVLVPTRLFDRIHKMQSRFESLCQRIEKGFSATPEAEGLSEIKAAVGFVRTRGQ